MPLVSVIMSVYNNERYVSQAIESILNQTFKKFEFIIVNDESTDGSEKIIKHYSRKDKRIKYIQNKKNIGLTRSLNLLLGLCKGKYVVRMDSDDWAFPNRIEKQVDFLERNNNVVVCGGNIEVSGSNLEPLNYREYPVKDSEIRKLMFRFNPYAHPSVTYRLDSVRKAGLYDENLQLTQDYDLYFRLGRIGKLANVPDLVLKLRIHKDSLSMSKSRKQEMIALYTRLKAWVEYRYPVRFSDVFYTIIQFFSMFFVPSTFKFWLFNFIRSKRKFS